MVYMYAQSGTLLMMMLATAGSLDGYRCHPCRWTTPRTSSRCQLSVVQPCCLSAKCLTQRSGLCRNQQDCVAEGSFTCIVNAPSWEFRPPAAGVRWATATGTTLVLLAGSAAASARTQVLSPSPPRIAKQYPSPPSARPPSGKSNLVFFITDDQDVELGSCLQ